jgi:hypothetical protein
VFRRFLIAVLIFLIAVLVAADRLGAIVAAHVLAGKVQNDEHLPSRPGASIGGIPFLTQAISGKYHDVTITANDVPVNGVTVTSLTADLHGVHIPISKVLHDHGLEVPVDRIDGTAFVAYADINSYLSAHHPVNQVLFLRAGIGNSATIVDRLRIAGRTVSLRGVGMAMLTGNVVGVKVSDLKRTSTGGAALGSKVLSRIEAQLRISVPLNDLPFRIILTSATFSASGVTVTGGAVHALLGAHTAG